MKCYRIVAAENFDVDNYLPTTEIEIIDLKLESKLTNIWKIPYVSSFFLNESFPYFITFIITFIKLENAKKNILKLRRIKALHKVP